MPRAAGIALAAPATLGELAARHGGAPDAAARGREVAGIRPPDGATEADLAPVLARRSLAAAIASPAALLVDASLAPLVPEGRRWVHAHAAWALAGLLAEIDEPPPATSALAVVLPGARVAPDARVGPGAVVRSGVVVGAGSVVEPNAVVYGNVEIGARVLVGAGAVVGRPGFGWARGPDGDVRRIPQLGGVVVEDDVEIGPLATIDAGTLGPTIVRRGARLDAHVHVGHNVEIGPGAMVAAQAGFAGSARVGAGVLVGGQAGVSDHVRVGDGARLGARAGVIGDVPPGLSVLGYPAVERMRWLRGMARLLGRGRAGRSRDPST